MFRTFLFVAGLCLASASELTEQANPEAKDVGEGDWLKKDQLSECVINSGEAIDSMLDATVYILASVSRCGKDTEKVRCAVDVSAAIGSVNEVVNTVIKAVSKCGAFDSTHAECGMATGVLTRAMAELTSASAQIVVKCPHVGHPGLGGNIVNVKAIDPDGYSSALGMCIIDVKDAMKELFKVIARFMTIKTNCVDENACAHNALKIVAGFAGIAEYVSGALAKCHPDPKDAQNAACTSASMRLFRAADNTARAGEAMAGTCKLTEAERLFLDSEDKVTIPSEGNGHVTAGLLALLPVAAVVGFVGGNRLAKARSAQVQTGYDAELAYE